MTTIYVVMEHGWEHGDVHAVYSSKSAANEHVEAEERRRPLKPSGGSPLLNVEAYELRDTFDPAILDA